MWGKHASGFTLVIPLFPFSLCVFSLRFAFPLRVLRALDGVVGGGFNHGGSGVRFALNVLVVVLEFFLRLFDQLLGNHVGRALGVVVAGVVQVVSVR